MYILENYSDRKSKSWNISDGKRKYAKLKKKRKGKQSTSH